MTRNELLHLLDKHFSCLEVHIDENGVDLRLISEMGQDLTHEFDRFMCEFLTKYQNPLQQANTQANNESKPWKICVVEDSDWLLEEMVDFFQQEGFEVTGCASGQSALVAFEGARFDLLLTDVEMPVMTGLELLATLKSHGIELPVVLMSANHAYGSTGMHHQAGAAAFFRKPFNMLEMKEQILRLLEKQ